MIRIVIGLLRRPAMLGWVLAALMAIVGGAYTIGRVQGAAASDARFAATQAHLQTQIIRAAEIASRKEAARLAAVAAADKLSRELEDASHTDRNAGRISLGTDSVRRLNHR